jgi:hypothetical protein
MTEEEKEKIITELVLLLKNRLNILVENILRKF